MPMKLINDTLEKPWFYDDDAAVERINPVFLSCVKGKAKPMDVEKSKNVFFLIREKLKNLLSHKFCEPQKKAF